MTDAEQITIVCYLAGWLATVSTLASADRDEHLPAIVFGIYALVALAWPLVWLVSFVCYWSIPSHHRQWRRIRALVLWCRRLMHRRHQ